MQVVGSRGKYEYITNLDSNNYNGPALNRAIVVHHWGVKGQKYDNVVATCMYGLVSAHYILMDGLVTCLVPPGLRAWHVANNDFQRVMPGVWNVNSYTIGIECRPECTPGDRETLAQLIAEIWCDYGKMPVYGHKDFMATLCPGDYYDYLPAIVARAEKIYKDIQNGTDGEDDWTMEFSKADLKYLHSLCDKHKAGEEPSEWAKDEVKEAVELGITDGSRPHDLVTREESACMALRTAKLAEKEK